MAASDICSMTSAQSPTTRSNATVEHGAADTIGEEEQQGLDEIAAGAPVTRDSSAESPAPFSHERRHGSSVGEEEQYNLTELGASLPVEKDEDQWRQESHIEDSRNCHEDEEDDDESKSTSPLKTWVTQLYIICHLIFFSILGVLARLGVQWMTFYPSAPVIFSNLWANVSGTLVMGFLLEDQRLFRKEWATESTTAFTDKGAPRGTPSIRASHATRKKTIPLYIGLTVGFCGSFTSFSTFERDAFLALANRISSPLSHPADIGSSASATVSRNGGYSFEALLAVIILTVAASASALKAGAHLAILLDRVMPVLPFRLVRNVFDPFVVFLGVGCWVGAIVMAAVPPDRMGGSAYQGMVETWRGQALFALVFAPVGCLLRFYLSLKLNPLVPWFPLGTFTANMFGTAVLGMTYDLQRVAIGESRAIGGGVTGCQVLQGVEDGFCGALTTISTWMVELTSLRRRHAYIYGSASILVALALLVVIMGSVLWTIGWSTPACVLETS